MNLNGLIAEVNDQRRDITSNFVNDGELTRYFNRCLRVLQAEHDWDFTQTSASFTYSTAGKYALSAIGDGYWKSPIDLFAGYPYQFNVVTPNDFSIIPGFLLVTNNTNITQLSASFYTSAMAKTSGGSWQKNLIDGTDEPLIPEQYQDLLVDYSLMRIFKKESLMDDFAISQKEFQKTLAMMKNEFIERTARPLYSWRHINDIGTTNQVLDKRENPLQQ